MKKIWTQGLEIPHFPQLNGDASTEVLVIGGGMSGILCAGNSRPGDRMSSGGSQIHRQWNYQRNHGSTLHAP